jgi:hypothetical protein
MGGSWYALALPFRGVSSTEQSTTMTIVPGLVSSEAALSSLASTTTCSSQHSAPTLSLRVLSNVACLLRHPVEDPRYVLADTALRDMTTESSLRLIS